MANFLKGSGPRDLSHTFKLWGLVGLVNPHGAIRMEQKDIQLPLALVWKKATEPGLLDS